MRHGNYLQFVLEVEVHLLSQGIYESIIYIKVNIAEPKFHLTMAAFSSFAIVHHTDD